MERTDTHIQHDPLRGVAGFTLVELLIGLAISSILALSLWSLASTQERTYGSQDSATEMQQNLRIAMQSLTRDIMAQALGPQSSTINGQNAGAWYNAANSWNAFNITATSIDIIGCGQTPATLSAQAASGTNTLALAAGEGAGFTASQNISIEGAENAVVTSVSGDTLTLSGNLSLTHPSGASVYPLRWVTYSVTGGVLNADQHNGSGPQAVASDITAMAITANATDPKALTVSLTGSTRQRHGASCLDGDGYGLPAEYLGGHGRTGEMRTTSRPARKEERGYERRRRGGFPRGRSRRGAARGNEGGFVVFIVMILILLLTVLGLAANRSIITDIGIAANLTGSVRTLYAAEAGATLAWNQLYTALQGSLNPALPVAANPAITGYTWTTTISTVPSGGPNIIQRPATGIFAGLSAFVQMYRITSTATDNKTGAVSTVTIDVEDQLIPIFQFGVFYNGVLETFPGATMTFTGWVHSNNSIYLGSNSSTLEINSNGHHCANIFDYRLDSSSRSTPRTSTRWGPPRRSTARIIPPRTMTA